MAMAGDPDELCPQRCAACMHACARLGSPHSAPLCVRTHAGLDFPKGEVAAYFKLANKLPKGAPAGVDMEAARGAVLAMCTPPSPSSDALIESTDLNALTLVQVRRPRARTHTRGCGLGLDAPCCVWPCMHTSGVGPRAVPCALHSTRGNLVRCACPAPL